MRGAGFQARTRGDQARCPGDVPHSQLRKRGGKARRAAASEHELPQGRVGWPPGRHVGGQAQLSAAAHAAGKPASTPIQDQHTSY